MMRVANVLGGAATLLMLSWLPARGAERVSVSPPPQEAQLQLEAVSLSAIEQAHVENGRIVLREVSEPELKGRTFEAVGILEATLDNILTVLSDFRHYDEFMPRVERTVVTDESETVALVEEHLKLPLGVRKRYRLRYTVHRGTDGFRIDWVKVAWPEVPLSQTVLDTSGYWQVARFGEGRLLAVYHVYTDPGRVPLGMKGLAQSLSKQEVPKVLESLRRRHAEIFGPRIKDQSMCGLSE
jgi:hypothetical protein